MILPSKFSHSSQCSLALASELIIEREESYGDAGKALILERGGFMW
jgi:hypothetical protein